MDTWIFIALLPPIFWGFTNVADAIVHRHYIKNDIVLTWLLTAMRLPIGIVLFLIFGMEMNFDINALWMFFAGLLWTLPIIFYFKALKFEEVSRVVILMQLIPIFTLIFAWKFLGEALSTQQIIGFFIILLAGTLAAFKRVNKNWHFSMAFIWVGLASFLWAGSDVMFKYLESSFNGFFEAFIFYFLGSNVPALLILFVPEKAKKIFGDFKKISAKMWIFIFTNGMIGVLGSFTLAYAFTITSVALVTVFVGLQPLFAFVYALILGRFMKEVPKESLNKEDIILKGTSLLLVFVGLIYLNY